MHLYNAYNINNLYNASCGFNPIQVGLPVYIRLEADITMCNLALGLSYFTAWCAFCHQPPQFMQALDLIHTIGWIILINLPILQMKWTVFTQFLLFVESVMKRKSAAKCEKMKAKKRKEILIVGDQLHVIWLI